jgi:geranylgeranyl diphosphate synthase type II
MHSFELLAQKFVLHFERPHFPAEPSSLYEPADYFLQMGGKRVRPVLCVMGNELFGEIVPDAWNLACAVELFHNFTLVHDDIMDKAPLRRGRQTVHSRYGESTALLTGDVMLVKAYEYINQIDDHHLSRILRIFNEAARQVCEGQQLDMDFEKREHVQLDDYLQMIALKTSVLLAASLKMGSILGGAGERNQNLLYAFGRQLGIAFQVQDDYLDAFGDPTKFGKQVGGDILSNKKTFLLLHAKEAATPVQQKELALAMNDEGDQKVNRVLTIYRDCKVDEWALKLKNQFLDEAFNSLEDVAVLSRRKQPLKDVASYLVSRSS